jgi:hypothetical protein
MLDEYMDVTQWVAVPGSLRRLSRDGTKPASVELVDTSP